MAEFELMCDQLCGELNVLVKQRVSTMFNERNASLEGLFSYVMNMPEFQRRFAQSATPFTHDVGVLQLSASSMRKCVNECVDVGASEEVRIVQISSNNIVLDVEEDDESDKDDSDNDEDSDSDDDNNGNDNESDSDEDIELTLDLHTFNPPISQVMISPSLHSQHAEYNKEGIISDKVKDAEPEGSEFRMRNDVKQAGEDFVEIEIDDVTYCTNDDENGFIYKVDDDGTVGDKVGYIKEGEPIFYE
jgi:hypothetical protein